MSHKLFKDLSLNITEEEYREDGYMHYSTLATYERGGFSAIETLGERKESSSLQFGSLVDCLITGTKEEFDSKYFIADFPKLEPSNITITQELFNRYKDLYNQVLNIPDEKILEVAEQLSYHSNWRPENKIKAIKEKCAEYYALLRSAEGKEVIDIETWNDAAQCYEALKNSKSTKWYFESDNPFDNSIERVYQPKLRATFNDITYSGMMDLIVIDHKNKLIYPCDLKTSSHYEYEFFKSFVQWGYAIQAGEYTAIIKQNIEKDDYFKDFEIMPYRFIVVNRNTKNPLVWEWPYSNSQEEVIIENKKSGYKYRFRNFNTIGQELNHYLQNNAKVPDGITELNSIKKWLENE